MKKVLEKLQNKKVLALYLLGVLLLSTGLSYAYFIATSSVNGNGAVSSVDTATIVSEGLAGDGNISFSESDIYPGHTAIASIKVTGTGENTPVLYNVVFEGTNTFTTPINYTIYKLDSNIDVSYSCTPKTGVVNGAMQYYEDCVGNNITSLGSPVKSGTISNGKTILLDNEIMITSEEGTITYYYVVIEYPNQDTEQNADIGSTFSGTIKVESNGKYPRPSVLFVGNTTQGSNGWYKSVSVTSNITSYTEDYTVEYCTTTSDTCTPNETPSLSDNSFTVNLDNNTNAQKVCVRVTDGYNQTGEGCSLSYKIDGENPTVNITNEQVDKTSIAITVSGSDSYSGISTYKFSKDNGSSYETVNTSEDSYTYTFDNLETGTSYLIKVQVVDEAGNIGEITKEISTESDREAANYILANEGGATAIEGKGTPDFAATATTDEGMYAAQDDWGTSYYYRGAVQDNWVKFGTNSSGQDLYWRIIRINGDGTIRLIYNGTSTVTTGTSTQIQTSAFNSTVNDNMYVGYMYESGQVHGLTSSSTIKGILDQWYQNNLSDEAEYIGESTGFCGDRTSYTNTSGTTNGGGTGTNETYYGAYIRLYRNNSASNASPSLECPYEDSNGVKQDLYTTSGSGQGNQALTNPIGLITADEVAMAGGVRNMGNTHYYLYTRQPYWTMSPYNFNPTYIYAYMFRMHLDGSLVSNGTLDNGGVRPVINLKANVSLTGSGTTSDPYKIS